MLVTVLLSDDYLFLIHFMYLDYYIFLIHYRVVDNFAFMMHLPLLRVTNCEDTVGIIG